MNYSIATLANTNALDDLKVFLNTIQIFNKDLPDIYLFCDTYIDILNLTYAGKIYKKVTLDTYDGLTRKMMEQMKGVNFRNKWEDFMCEKMKLLEWAHETCERVLFCDSDICFMGPLPVIPEWVTLGLSKHMIRMFDEKRFGTFNGGFVFSGDKGVPEEWSRATYTSRYFEQAALEDLVDKFKTIFFPIQNNYGWWRLLQGEQSVETLKKKWSVKNNIITVEDLPLLSIHTHWKTDDKATRYFNDFVKGFIQNEELLKILDA
jgi:hypothetical protein